jgi:catechol 2,3-dioxygenase-like lactoylglutathione lyase family enzyme
LFDHVHLVVEDIEASKRFYRAVLQVVDIPLGGEAADHFWADELFISSAQPRASRGELTGRVHLALRTNGRETVNEFHRAGLAAGGKDNGAPGEGA